MKLSVCIPVYKVESYIEQCARSLFEQTYEDLEYIFIDDCTPDKSIEVVKKVLEDYPKRKSQVKFVRHEKNSGLIRGRKTGIENSTGDFITHIDPDDWIDLDYYEKMMTRQKEVKADMVFAPMVFNENKPLGGWQDFDFLGTGVEYIQLIGKVVAFNSNVNKIFRRDIATDTTIIVPDHIRMGEDLCRTMQMIPKCRTVASVKGTFYHYRENFESMSRKFDCRRTIDELTEIYDILKANLKRDITRTLRKHLIRDIVFSAMKFGVMTKSEHAKWLQEMKELKDLPWPEDTPIKRRVMLFIVEKSYKLSKLMFRYLSDGKVTGF